MNPKHKVALITGGARIGRTVAALLAERGARVALTYKTSLKNARETAAEVERLGQKSLLIKSDLAKKGAAKQIIRELKKKFGALHILIHMASIYQPTPFKTLRDAQWEEHMRVELKSAYELSLHAASLMKRSGGGRIITISDWTARSGRPRYKHLLPYYVAKSGIIGLTEALALELAPSILVNSIAPGPIIKPRGFKGSDDKEVLTTTPLRRWGGPLEIAKAVLFLIDSDFITGETIRIDGGRHLI